MNKVVHISTVHPTFDGRIFHKECVSLADVGYDTHLIVTHTKNEEVNGVKIHALSKYKNRVERIFKGNKEALKIARQLDAEIFHLHDPELLPLGLKLKKEGKKVIFDMHELAGLMIKSKTWIPFVLRWSLSYLYSNYERRAFKNFDKIIVVTEKMVSDYTDVVYPKYKNKVAVIRNLSLISKVENSIPVSIKNGKEIVLIYVGGLTSERGIKEVVQSIQSISNVKLWLLGPWENEVFEAECVTADTGNKVQYFGLKPMLEVYNYIKAADIGLTILHPTVNHLSSLPVKAFEYMAANKPQIMSNFPFWMDAFDGCALFIDPSNQQEIENAIKKLVQDQPLREKIGNYSYQTVAEKYSWEEESKKLKAIYTEIYE